MLNIFVMYIVIVALAGTKGKLDIVDAMLQARAKREGVAPKKKFTEKDYDAIEYAVNIQYLGCRRKNEEEYDEDNIDQLMHYEEILEKVRHK